ncbi:MAG: hypothetical protein H7338_22840, partial [Candidatus Sericytochromatia bacterium]|nr:hypothetical protein [Candidatus Sericytochromatia bacterium]
GETVTVQGFGFGGSGTVTLGDEPGTVTSWQSGQLVIRTAVGARGGDLIIKPDGRRPIRSGQPVRIRQQWRTWPELPVPVGGETVAVGSLDGQLVVAGGKDATGKAIGAVWGYAGRSGQWRSLAPLPTPRYGMTSAVLGNRLYAIGGWSDSTGYSPVVEVYDPATDSWQRRAPLPTGLLGAAAAAVNGQVIVCGGYNGTEQANTYLYDPAGNTWTARSVMPQARFRHGAANFDGRILVAGGRSGNQPSSNVIQFDLVANVWSDTTSLPATRAGGTMVSDGVTAWFVDGSDGRPQATLWGFNGAGWVTLAIPPTARASISGTFGAGEVVIVGGTSGDAAAGRRVESFTP